MDHDSGHRSFLFNAFQSQGKRLTLITVLIVLVTLVCLAIPAAIAIYAIENSVTWPVLGGLMIMTFTGEATLLWAVRGIVREIGVISTARIESVARHSVIGAQDSPDPPRREGPGDEQAPDIGTYIEPDGFDRDAATPPEAASAVTAEARPRAGQGPGRQQGDA